MSTVRALPFRTFLALPAPEEAERGRQPKGHMSSSSMALFCEDLLFLQYLPLFSRPNGVIIHDGNAKGALAEHFQRFVTVQRMKEAGAHGAEQALQGQTFTLRLASHRS